MLYVLVGISGNWEVGKTYYIDKLQVNLEKKIEGSQFYSFENDFEGWDVRGTDLEHGGGFIDSSIAMTPEIWEDGANSLKFDLNNLNGKGKIWVERAFTVEPRRKYRVSMDYAFRTWDCLGTPRFRLISGALRSPPETANDIAGIVQEKTSSYTDTGCNFGWMHKNYDFIIKSKKSDTLYVIIGVSGTEAAHRNYWIDSVCVTITPK